MSMDRQPRITESEEKQKNENTTTKITKDRTQMKPGG